MSVGTDSQAASSGGRVYVVVHQAVNLPDSDGFSQSGLSDPYVQFEVGSTVATTTVVDESLNPVRCWPIDIDNENTATPC